MMVEDIQYELTTLVKPIQTLGGLGLLQIGSKGRL